MTDYDQRISQLERRVDRLDSIVLVLACIVGLLAIGYVASLTRYVLIGLVLAIPLLVLFHRRLPSLGRRIGSFIGRFAKFGPRD